MSTKIEKIEVTRTERIQVQAGEVYNLLKDTDKEYDTNHWNESEADVANDADLIETVADYFAEEAYEAAEQLLKDESEDGRVTLISMDYTEADAAVLAEAATEHGICITWTSAEEDEKLAARRKAEAEARAAAEAKARAAAETYAASLRCKWIDRAKYMIARGGSLEDVRQAVIFSREDTGSVHPQIIHTLRQLGLVPPKR